MFRSRRSTVLSVIIYWMFQISDWRRLQVRKLYYQIIAAFHFHALSTTQMCSPNKHCFKICQFDHRGNFISETSLDETDKSWGRGQNEGGEGQEHCALCLPKTVLCCYACSMVRQRTEEVAKGDGDEVRKRKRHETIAGRWQEERKEKEIKWKESECGEQWKQRK